LVERKQIFPPLKARKVINNLNCTALPVKFLSEHNDEQCNYMCYEKWLPFFCCVCPSAAQQAELEHGIAPLKATIVATNAMFKKCFNFQRLSG
jgi:hypothetical protein